MMTNNQNGKQTLIINQKNNEIESLKLKIDVLEKRIKDLEKIIEQKDQMIEKLFNLHK